MLTLPTTAEPGDAVRLTVALLDIVGNAGVDFTGDVTLYDVPAGLELPERIRFTPEHRGRQTISGRVHTAGTFRIQGRTDGDPSIPEAESNPLVVLRVATVLRNLVVRQAAGSFSGRWVLPFRSDARFRRAASGEVPDGRGCR